MNSSSYDTALCDTYVLMTHSINCPDVLQYLLPLSNRMLQVGWSGPVAQFAVYGNTFCLKLCLTAVATLKLSCSAVLWPIRQFGSSSLTGTFWPTYRNDKKAVLLHLLHKIRMNFLLLLRALPYNLYCVGGDVKHCSLTHSLALTFNFKFLVCFYR